MQFLILTGMSGAGKTVAIRIPGQLIIRHTTAAPHA